MTRGSQTSAFPPKLASHNRRPLDPKDNKGLQFGTNIHTRAASPSATHSPQSGKISSAHCRDRQTVAKASNQSSRSLSRRISEPGFPSSQGRWVLAPRNQPSEPQLTHCPAPLQNGGYQDCEGTYEKRRLANKARSEGYLSFSANESATHTPSEGSMAEPNISVRHTSFRALQCPLRFHKAPQAGSGNFEKVGNQGCSLLRQHADHGKLQGGSPSPPIATAMHLLTALGFILNLNKSVLTPTQRVIFLGFCLDSRTMRISLPTPRIQSIQRLIRETLAQGELEATILKLSQLLGSMVSTHPAVLAAPLHYRHLERAKITALRHSHNYNTVVTT